MGQGERNHSDLQLGLQNSIYKWFEYRTKKMDNLGDRV